MKDTLFYLGIMAAVIHADLWQQLVFIGFLSKTKTNPLFSIMCIPYNTISKTKKITNRDMQ